MEESEATKGQSVTEKGIGKCPVTRQTLFHTKFVTVWAFLPPSPYLGSFVPAIGWVFCLWALSPRSFPVGLAEPAPLSSFWVNTFISVPTSSWNPACTPRTLQPISRIDESPYFENTYICSVGLISAIHPLCLKHMLLLRGGQGQQPRPC